MHQFNSSQPSTWQTRSLTNRLMHAANHTPADECVSPSIEQPLEQYINRLSNSVSERLLRQTYVIGYAASELTAQQLN
eukprot:10385167-Alexandrium_andersonii.AAC.1